MQNPCDFENFAQFMAGIHSEIEEYASGIYDADDNNHTPDWLTYEEGVEYIKKYMLNDLKQFYNEECDEDIYLNYIKLY